MKYFQLPAFCCIVVMLSLPAMAQVTISETNTPNGTFSLFSYSLTNVGQIPIAALTIDVQTPVTNLTAPAGWTVGSSPFGNDTLINWAASDTPYALQPNSTLAGFSFVSTPATGNVTYSAFDNDFNNFDGTTQGPVPAAVPEASSMTSFGIGLAFLIVIALAVRFRAKRKARPS